MKIGFTYDLKTDFVKKDSDPKDLYAELDKPETMEAIVRAFEKAGHKVIRIGNVHNLLKKINDLDVDIVFNICEGVYGRNRESQVPVILETIGIPYVGGDGLTLGVTLDKVYAKKIFIEGKIPTPKYFVAHYTDDLKKKNTIGYPLIVKTRMEGSSKGIHQGSRVTNLSELQKRVEYINKNYNQTALVEEFIAGMECTVPVLGNENPMAMPVAQVRINGSVDLGDEYYTNDRIYSDSLKYVVPATFDDKLTEKVQEIAIEVYKCVDCRDFGRIDFRIDQKGNPYVLEINPLPTLDLEDVFNMFPNVFGSTYDDVVNLVLNLAMVRYGMINKSEKELLTQFTKKEVPTR